MNHASNSAAEPDRGDLSIVDGADHDVVSGLWHGALGRTVRCVPWRRTIQVETDRGRVFAKLFTRRRGGAANEWRWLHMLPMLGLRGPEPIAYRRRGRRAMVVTGEVEGRSLDAWIRDAEREGWLDDVYRFCARHVAAAVRRLHEQDLVHRDLNFPHLYSVDPRRSQQVSMIDVERMFKIVLPWRRRRWVVKDLASLLASSPAPVPCAMQWRFLRRYLPDVGRGERRRLGRAVAAKAQRIARHRPRFG